MGEVREAEPRDVRGFAWVAHASARGAVIRRRAAWHERCVVIVVEASR